MNAEERREARRRRILENSEIRLKKITLLSTKDSVPNVPAVLVNENTGNTFYNLYFICISNVLNSK